MWKEAGRYRPRTPLRAETPVWPSTFRGAGFRTRRAGHAARRRVQALRHWRHRSVPALRFRPRISVARGPNSGIEKPPWPRRCDVLI